MSWNKLNSKELFKNRWMWITEDEVETDSGAKSVYTVVHKKPFALIIPWDGRHFTLVGQYRYNVDFDSWEFPQGHYEHSSILETAKKELKEETGLTARHIEQINSFFIAPGAIDQECNVFLATDLTEGVPELERSEDGLRTRKATLAEVRALIEHREIKDGPTIAALSLLEMGRPNIFVIR